MNWQKLLLLFLPALAFAKTEARNGGSFNINDLVDWDSIKVPNSADNNNAIAGSNDELASNDIPASPLDPEDFRASDYVEDDMFSNFEEDPIESAGLFEGDIDNVSMDDLQSTDTRNYHDKTCIRFKPRTSETAYIHIMKGSGCSSSVGRTGSSQSVSLGNGCVYTGIVMHELMHAAGFWHEQSRADRDSHIRINWKNIITGMEYNFLKYDLNKIDHLKAEYDTCSVMHYGAYAFSKGRSPTIEAIREGECKLGQREGFSDTDIRKLNTLYECRGYPQTGAGETTVTKPTPTTAKPWVKPKCQDQNKYCATWAKMDECKKNPSWMLVYCPVACDQCGVSCEDNNVYCDEWAKLGECSKNSEYMNIYCAKACKQCKASVCEDENTSCSGWAAKGYCKEKYKDYMSLRCKKSCNLC